MFYSKIQKCGIRVFFTNDFEASELKQLSQDQVHDLFLKKNFHPKPELPFCSLDQVLSELLLEEFPCDGRKIQLLMDYFRRLKLAPESALERDNDYQDMKSSLSFYDSHSKGTTFFIKRQHSKSLSEKDYEIDRSGKPDGVHHQFPAYLEIKGSDFAHLSGLDQGLERILASISTYQLFSKHLVFVQEKVFSFVLYCDLSNPIQSITIYLLRLEDFAKLLFILNSNLSEPRIGRSWYYHKDSSCLLKIFRLLNQTLFNNTIVFGNCQIEKIAESSSSVYKMIFGRNVSGKATIDSIEDPCFILKINYDISRSSSEIKALERITAHYRAKNLEHYSIGYYTSELEAIIFFFDEFIHEFQYASTITEKYEGNSTSRYWFEGQIEEEIFSPGKPYTILLMRQGVSLQQQELSTTIYKSLLQSIKYIHEAGVVHRDLRSCNFMHFPMLPDQGQYLVIDFDLSAIVAESKGSVTTTIKNNSGQASRIPLLYRDEFKKNGSLKEITVNWSYDDDIAMLCEYVFSRLQMSPEKNSK